MRNRILLLGTIAFVTSGYTSVAPAYDDWPSVSGPYLGQQPPGMTAEKFALDIVSTDQSEVNSVFSPDGEEFYFTTWMQESGTKILVTRQVEGRWSVPQRASFSTDPSDVDPAISHDGQRVFFSSRRPRPGESMRREDGFDMWFADREGSSWGEAQFLGPVVNSGKSQVYPSVTRDGTFYFQAVREEGYGKADIYRSSLIDGAYQTLENLGPVINSEKYEGDAFVAPDESYLIITVYGREDGFGKGDLYISFRSPDGSWSPLKNMGSAINSAKRDFSPMVSPDGKYLFFSSKRAGKGDIFWVAAKVIEALNDEQERSDVQHDLSGDYLGYQPPGTTPELFAPGLVSTGWHDSYPYAAADGTLYFFSRRPGGYGKSDLYVSRWVDGKYEKSENIGSIKSKYSKLKSVAEQWITLWCTPVDWELFDCLHTEKFEDCSSAGRPSTKQGFTGGLAELVRAFPDLQTIVTGLVIDESTSQVGVRWAAKGTNKSRFLGSGPTNRVTSITALSRNRKGQF